MSPSEQMKRRLVGLPPPCVSTSNSPKALYVYLASGARKVLHWPRFVQADLGVGENELILIFAESEVVIQGTHLASVMDSVARLEVESLRTVPAAYSGLLVPSEAFIRSLDVRVRTE